MATFFGQVVPAPPPTPAQYGLIAAARDPRDNSRWQAGFSYLPFACAGTGPYDSGCAGGSKASTTNPSIVKFQPVVLEAGDKCSPWDRTRDYPARARTLLDADQSRQLAHEFWAGTLAQANGYPNNYLARNDNVNEISLTPMGPTDALACLEDRLASCTGRRGMIHCTPGTLVLWDAEHLVERVGQNIITKLGTVVVADPGYPGTGPHGQAELPGTVWAYATDMVDVRLDDVQVFPEPDEQSLQALERSQNTFEFHAERLAAATFDGCCHLAVPIDVPVCTRTGGS